MKGIQHSLAWLLDGYMCADLFFDMQTDSSFALNCEWNKAKLHKIRTSTGILLQIKITRKSKLDQTLAYVLEYS